MYNTVSDLMSDLESMIYIRNLADNNNGVLPMPNVYAICRDNLETHLNSCFYASPKGWDKV